NVLPVKSKRCLAHDVAHKNRNGIQPSFQRNQIYDGNPDYCRSFLMQCMLYTDEHPIRILEDALQVRFMNSLLSGRLLNSVKEFQRAFREEETNDFITVGL
uniref:Uncharacterized protein n=1 Tax=Paramormyrops kingsleyae TaxID=1676925 RepID=A0A3B3SYM4_9TELE